MQTKNLIPNFLIHEDNLTTDHKQTAPDPRPNTHGDPHRRWRNRNKPSRIWSTSSCHDILQTHDAEESQTQPKRS